MNEKLTLDEALIQVLPKIDTGKWNPVCPSCKSSIEIEPASYISFSHRHWCYGNCPNCTKEYVLDVPALLYNNLYPQIMNKSTGEVYGVESWWNRELPKLYFHYYEEKDFEKSTNQGKGKIQNLQFNIKAGNFAYLKDRILSKTGNVKSDIHYKSSAKPTVEVIRKNDSANSRIIFFNAIDEYYGHCTRYLQFVYNFYEDHAQKLTEQKLRTVLLLPEYLKFYAPDFIDEIWLAKHLPNPFGRKTFTSREFSDQVNALLRSHHEVYLPVKQNNLFKGVDADVYFKTDKAFKIADIKIGNKTPKFLFYNREDWRTWGGSGKSEIKHYEALAKLLKQKYPESIVYIIGMDNSLPVTGENIVDLRQPPDTKNLERTQCNLIKLLTHIDCAVGVHGSHMTEISALCKSVVTLQPSYKYVNYTDDMFLIRSENFIADLSRFFPLFGNETLTDISVEKVFDIIQSAMHRYATGSEFQLWPGELEQGLD